MNSGTGWHKMRLYVHGKQCPREASSRKSRERTVTGTVRSGTHRQGTHLFWESVNTSMTTVLWYIIFKDISTFMSGTV
jgi:hypothetical protein